MIVGSFAIAIFSRQPKGRREFLTLAINKKKS